MTTYKGFDYNNFGGRKTNLNLNEIITFPIVPLFLKIYMIVLYFLLLTTKLMLIVKIVQTFLIKQIMIMVLSIFIINN